LPNFIKRKHPRKHPRKGEEKKQEARTKVQAKKNSPKESGHKEVREPLSIGTFTRLCDPPTPTSRYYGNNQCCPVLDLKKKKTFGWVMRLVL